MVHTTKSNGLHSPLKEIEGKKPYENRVMKIIEHVVKFRAEKRAGNRVKQESKNFSLHLQSLYPIDHPIGFNGTELLTILKCWVDHLQQISFVTLNDSSNVRYSKLLKTGKTFYESRGFELFDPNTFDEFIRNLYQFDFKIFEDPDWDQVQYGQNFPTVSNCLPTVEDQTMEKYITRCEQNLFTIYRGCVGVNLFYEIVNFFDGILFFKKEGYFREPKRYVWTLSKSIYTMRYPPNTKGSY